MIGDPSGHLLVRPGGASISRRRAGLASPEEDFDAEVFAQLYSKLAATMSAAQTVAGGGGEFLSLMLPGQYLEQNLDPAAPFTQYLLSNLLNPTLECSWIVRRGAASIADVYESILNGKETPLVKLTSQQKSELDAATGRLYQPDGEATAYYADYLAAAMAYAAARDSLDEATATQRNGGPPVPADIIAAVAAAEKRWREHGHLADVDRDLATIASLEAFEPAVFWHKLAQRYRDFTRRWGEDSQYQRVDCIPPYPRWFDDEGWTSFRFDDLDFKNQDRSGGIGVGDGCRCQDVIATSAYGGFHGGPADSGAGGRRLLAGVPERFVLTASLRRVQILRPWLDPLVLRSRAWRWSPASASYGVLICGGGNLAGAVVPTGVMPMLATTALLAKDVVIDWSDTGLRSALRQQQALGHEVRYGPFRLTGATLLGNHVSMKDPQLIGFLSELLPRSPDPDPRLPWPQHAALTKS